MRRVYDISDPLRFLLAKNRITAYEFSKRAGISRSVTSEYLSGKKKASLARIDLFCRYFGVDKKFFVDFQANRSELDGAASDDGSAAVASIKDIIQNCAPDELDSHQLNSLKIYLLKEFGYLFDTSDAIHKFEMLVLLENLIKGLKQQ
ncbi:MAG: helix-turn-helix transcriptional regulator [Holdemanella sp.]|nr:helix-turn-helix transcriptional regulator [Holdemanella sp.]